MSVKSNGGPEKFNIHVGGFVSQKESLNTPLPTRCHYLTPQAKMFPTADDVQCSQRMIIPIWAT
jgi:hypothetical protein